MGFIQPNHWAGGDFFVSNYSSQVNHKGSSPLDENHGLFKPVLVVDFPLWVGEDRERQAQSLGVVLGFIESVPQDQHDLAIGCLEVMVKLPQLGGMEATLHSVIFPHKEEIDVALRAEIR